MRFVSDLDLHFLYLTQYVSHLLWILAVPETVPSHNKSSYPSYLFLRSWETWCNGPLSGCSSGPQYTTILSWRALKSLLTLWRSLGVSADLLNNCSSQPIWRTNYHSQGYHECQLLKNGNYGERELWRTMLFHRHTGAQHPHTQGFRSVWRWTCILTDNVTKRLQESFLHYTHDNKEVPDIATLIQFPQGENPHCSYINKLSISAWN